MSRTPRRRESEYTPALSQPLDFLGSVHPDIQHRAHLAAATGGNFDQTLSPQVQVMQALQRQDIDGLRQALMSNPNLLTGNPILMEQLRRSEFFQQHRQDIADALRAPIGENMPATSERLNMAAQIAGLTPESRTPAGQARQAALSSRVVAPQNSFG